MYSIVLIGEEASQEAARKVVKSWFPSKIFIAAEINFSFKGFEICHALFLSMVNGSFKGETAKVRSQLLEYCKLDTYAMVKILERLKKV